jgi:hypothetical protein
MERLQLLAGIESIEQRHANVNDDDIGRQLSSGFHERASVGHRADDIKFRLQ